ncbi:MAG: DUF1631 family protein [Xanthomonadaceae bacterium]|nr:DUF1631 family protein [Xanthomonadaceae bacterium]
MRNLVGASGAQMANATTMASAGTPLNTLANTRLPRLPRQALEHLLGIARKALEEQLPAIMHEAELVLARTPAGGDPKLQEAHLTSIRSLGAGARTFGRVYLGEVEQALANMSRKSASQAGNPQENRFEPTELSLLDDDDISDDAILDNMASRMEARNSLGLQLLGLRLGVLAGAPAFEGENLPLGPHALCHALSVAATSLMLSRYAKLQLFQQFERAMVDAYPPLLESFNTSLVEDGILPHLSFVPVRVRPGSAAPDAGRDAAPATPPESPAAPSPLFDTVPMRAPEPAPVAAFPASAAPAETAPGFGILQALLNQRRGLLSKLRPGNREERSREPLDHDNVLAGLQRMRAGNVTADSLGEYRQILLAQARQLQGHGVALSQADNDTFDLLVMFVNQLQGNLRKSSLGETLIGRLKLPLLQMALRDQSFFVDVNHPARQLLHSVSQAGANWLPEDDLDPQWLGLLQRAVLTIQQEADCTTDTFADANKTLQSGLQALTRKAEMAERRQVEAARGREKLEVARHRAQLEIARRTQGRNLPAFQTALLEQAWVDVLSLAHLRSGDQSDAWHQLLEVTTRIIDACTDQETGSLQPADIECMRSSLELVGYHAEGADVITQHLATGQADASENCQALLTKYATQPRLGEDQVTGRPENSAPLTSQEQTAQVALRNLEAPTWMEVQNEQGQTHRYRLAWVSAQTGQILVVNRRGQRIANDDLDSLSRKLAAGQMRLRVDDASPTETAWDATVDNLTRFGHDTRHQDPEARHGG